MWGQIPNHIHILLKKPQVYSIGIIVDQFSQFAFFDYLFYFSDRPGIDKSMIH